MNLRNIIEFFQTLGITMVIDEKGDITLIDNKSQEKMKSYCINNPTIVLSSNDIENDLNVIKLLSGGRIKATSNNYALMFKLKHPVIDGKSVSDIVIAEMKYAIAENGVVKELYSISLDDDRNTNVSIDVSKENNIYGIRLFLNGDIGFIKDRKVGYYYGTFDEDYSLKKEEMMEVLNYAKLVEEIANYYSPIFSDAKENIINAKKTKELLKV